MPDDFSNAGCMALSQCCPKLLYLATLYVGGFFCIADCRSSGKCREAARSTDYVPYFFALE
jgi:hypothetical protein